MKELSNFKKDSPRTREAKGDESYFKSSRVRDKRGRGARGKTIVFGLLRREGNKDTQIDPDLTNATLQGIIRGKVDPNSVVCSDGWRG